MAQPENYLVYKAFDEEPVEININFFFPNQPQSWHENQLVDEPEPHISDFEQEVIGWDDKTWDDFEEWLANQDHNENYDDRHEYYHVSSADLDRENQDEKFQWFVKNNVAFRTNPKRYRIVGVLDDGNIALVSDKPTYPYFTSEQGGQVQYFKPCDFSNVFVEWKCDADVWEDIFNDYVGRKADGQADDIKEVKSIICKHFEKNCRLGPTLPDHAILSGVDIERALCEMMCIENADFQTVLSRNTHSLVDDDNDIDAEDWYNDKKLIDTFNCVENHHDIPLLGSKLFNNFTHKVCEVIDHNKNGLVLQYHDHRFHNEVYTVFLSLRNEAEVHNFKSTYKLVWSPQSED